MVEMDASRTTRRTRAEDARFVIAAVRAMGIEPHPQSRLMRMCRVLTRAAGIIEPDDPDFDTALEAERDMQLLGFVFDQSYAHGNQSDLQSLVERMLDDSVLPQDNREQSKGRDTQFELFVAAICQGAGFGPVDYQEPDVTCMVQGTRIGVAAKRIKSETQVKKRIPKAAKQIQASGLLGVIALDTSVALNPNNERITTPIPDEEFAALHSNGINRFLRRYDERIRRWVHQLGVLGMIVHDHQVRFQGDATWSLSGMTTRFCTAEDEQGQRLFRLFESPYVDALPNMQHV